MEDHFCVIRNAVAEYSPIRYQLITMDLERGLSFYRIEGKEFGWDRFGERVGRSKDSSESCWFGQEWVSVGDLMVDVSRRSSLVKSPSAITIRPKADHEVLMIRRTSPFAKQPEGFQLVRSWSNGSIWKPIHSDPNVVAMGYVASSRSDQAPPLNAISMVYKSCLNVIQSAQEREEQGWVRHSDGDAPTKTKGQSGGEAGKMVIRMQKTPEKIRRDQLGLTRTLFVQTFLGLEEDEYFLKPKYNVRLQTTQEPIQYVEIGNRYNWSGDDSRTGGSPNIAYWRSITENNLPPSGYGTISDFVTPRPFSEVELRSFKTCYVLMDDSVSTRMTYTRVHTLSGTHTLHLRLGTAQSTSRFSAERYRCIGLYTEFSSDGDMPLVANNMLAVHEDYLVSFPQVSFNDTSFRLWLSGNRDLGIFRPFSDLPCLNYYATTGGFRYAERFRPITRADRVSCCMGQTVLPSTCGDANALNYLAPSRTYTSNRCDRYFKNFCEETKFVDRVCGCLDYNQLPSSIRNTAQIVTNIASSSEWQCFNMKCGPQETESYKPSQFLQRTCDISICSQLSISEGVGIVQSGNTSNLTCPGGTSGGSGGGSVTAIIRNENNTSNNPVTNFITLGSEDGSVNYLLVIGVVVLIAFILAAWIASARGKRLAEQAQYEEYAQLQELIASSSSPSTVPPSSSPSTVLSSV